MWVAPESVSEAVSRSNTETEQKGSCLHYFTFLCTINWLYSLQNENHKNTNNYKVADAT